MADHVKVLGWLALARALPFEIPIGWFMLYKADHLAPQDFPTTLEETLCKVVGVTLIALAIIHAVQGLAALRRWKAARAWGYGLAILDILMIVLFPVTTALGLYGLVVYRHPETRQLFEERCRRAAAPA